jgi:hypothetical protein
MGLNARRVRGRCSQLLGSPFDASCVLSRASPSARRVSPQVSLSDKTGATPCVSSEDVENANTKCLTRKLPRFQQQQLACTNDNIMECVALAFFVCFYT